MNMNHIIDILQAVAAQNEKKKKPNTKSVRFTFWFKKKIVITFLQALFRPFERQTQKLAPFR